MKSCPTCKRVLSDNASDCPGCGHRFTSPVAWLVIGVVGFIALCVIGGLLVS